MDAMYDIVHSADEKILRKAEETLKKFHDNPQVSFRINRDRALKYAIEIGFTKVFKYRPRTDDVRRVACFSKNSDFLLKSREEGTITESLIELIIYARECNNLSLVIALASKSKL